MGAKISKRHFYSCEVFAAKHLYRLLVMVNNVFRILNLTKVIENLNFTSQSIAKPNSQLSLNHQGRKRIYNWGTFFFSNFMFRSQIQQFLKLACVSKNVSSILTFWGKKGIYVRLFGSLCASFYPLYQKWHTYHDLP